MTIDGIKRIEARHVTLVTLLSYVIGFVITNIYLANFAFAEFSFFHIKFIPVGFLFLLLSLSVYFLFQYVDINYKERQWYVRIPLFILMTGAIIFCLGIIFANRVDAIAGYTQGSVFRFDFGIWVVLNLILYFIISALLDTKDILMKNFKDIEKGYRLLNRIFFLIFLSIFNIGLFANLIYPSVPTYLGGGRQIQAAIVLEGSESPDPTFIRIIYQTPEYLLYESLASSTNSTKVTMVPFERIDSIEYLGIDAGTGHYIFSRYLAGAKKIVETPVNE